MELQVSKGQTQVGFPIVRIQLQRGLEVGGSLSRFLEIIQHEAALDISRGHFRIPLQSDREILHGKIQVAIVCVDIPRNQRQVLVVGQNGLVLVDQGQSVIVATEVVKIVGEIDDSFAIIRKLRNYVVTQLRGLGHTLP